LEKIMVESQVAMAKSDEKSGLEKEASAAIYLNHTKESIEIQRMYIEAEMADAEAKKMGVEAKIRAEDTRIMLANLATMDDNTKTWFLKKGAKIRARDA
jgi:hypothetical protein